jgi:hypothetical protein
MEFVCALLCHYPFLETERVPYKFADLIAVFRWVRPRPRGQTLGGDPCLSMGDTARLCLRGRRRTNVRSYRIATDAINASTVSN